MKRYRDRLFRLTPEVMPILSIFTAVFILTFSLADAAVWENVPSLPQAKKLKQDELLINNSPVQSIIYLTDVSVEEIIEFYKTKLINFGWKLESGVENEKTRVLLFSKREDYANIMISDFQGKNYITIAQSKIPQENDNPEEEPACPECKDELKKSFAWMHPSDIPGRDLPLIPRYPEAIRVNSMERENGRKADLSYYTRGSLEDVLSFYRRNMGNESWELEKEIDFQKLSPELSDALKLVDLKGKSLIFKGPIGKCIISVLENPQEDEDSRIIGIKYNAK
jgi:hypothetical protein